jgi:hypothetical protein
MRMYPYICTHKYIYIYVYTSIYSHFGSRNLSSDPVCRPVTQLAVVLALRLRVSARAPPRPPSLGDSATHQPLGCLRLACFAVSICCWEAFFIVVFITPRTSLTSRPAFATPFLWTTSLNLLLLGPLPRIWLRIVYHLTRRLKLHPLFLTSQLLETKLFDSGRFPPLRRGGTILCKHDGQHGGSLNERIGWSRSWLSSRCAHDPKVQQS